MTPSGTSPVVTRRHSAMSSLRASATIIVLRVLPRPSAVRKSNHFAKALSFVNVIKHQANWIMPRRTRAFPARVPVIGPIISRAMVAAIGSGAAFARGRDFSAWIGLVPKQMSTGDRTILGHISKRGNSYLRTLFMQAARVILLRRASWPKHGFGIWLAHAAQRLHPNVLAAALANKLARIAW